MSPEQRPRAEGQIGASGQVFHTIISTLQEQRVPYKLLEHQPVYTMEQAQEVCGSLPEEGVKVLFARAYTSKKDFQYCLIVWTGNKPVDFQRIATTTGVKKIKLANPEEVREELGIEIGALAPFGYDSSFPTLLDSALLGQSRLFINPGVHDKTIELSPDGLHSIMERSTKDLHLM